jgi:KaiC/GvpD/RAD55 family RecA-like ATPase
MPSARTDLLEKLIGSETKAELLMYFHDNPDSTETIEKIAAKIKRNPKEIARDVSDLVELGLLQEVRVISFSKDRDQELQKEISQRLASGPLEETTSLANRDLTGIGMIDSLLPDGYPSSSVVLVMGDPATGKTTLLIQLVAEALKKGRSVVYATLDDFPDSIRDSMKQMGLNLRDYETEGRRKLVFLDCYSFLVGVKSQELYSEDPQRLSDLSIVMSKALSEARESSNVLLAMDSLTTLIQRSGVRPSFDFLHTLIAKVRSNRASCVTSLSRKAFHPAIIAAIQDKVDGVIEMKVEDTKDGLSRFIRVSKMKGVRHTTTWTPYDRDPSMGLIIPLEESRMKRTV